MMHRTVAGSDEPTHFCDAEDQAGKSATEILSDEQVLEVSSFNTIPKVSEQDQNRSNTLERPPSSPSAHSHHSSPITHSVAVYRDSKDTHSSAFDHEKGADVAVVEAPSSAGSSSDLQQERKWKRKSIIQFGALCLAMYLEGWNDGSIGPLLPVIQRDFHIGYAVVSLLFVSNCIGYVGGAFANVWIDQRFGLGKAVVFGASIQLSAYAILAPASSFAAMVVAYGLSGFGMSLQNAQENGFVASLKNNVSIKLGMLHAAYGLGAFSSPFLATYFSLHKRWSFHFLCTACISVVNVVVLLCVFRLKRQQDLLIEAGQISPEGKTSEHAPNQTGLFRQIMTTKAVYTLALFSLIYVGVEVSLGGWIVTFIIQQRDGGPKAGYISSGFFGLTLGRVTLMWLNKIVGERRLVFIYVLICIVFEITIWTVPSIVENAISISIIGFLFGPIFPILISHATKVLPSRLITGSVGLITSIGISGSALLPFITGILASKYGIGSLQPLMVSMMCVMVLIWALVPKAKREGH